MSTDLRRRAPGFTLLEVLAAVAVLALVYTALARAAMQGLAHEGDATRRLEASMLADLKLNDVEVALAGGQLPAAEETQVDLPQGSFAVAVEPRPFDLGGLALMAAQRMAGQRDESAEHPAPRTGTPAAQLLTAGPGAPSPLYQIEVQVRWLEGADEQQVTRTTFAADPTVVQAALGSQGGQPGEGGQTPQTPGGAGQRKGTGSRPPASGAGAGGGAEDE